MKQHKNRSVRIEENIITLITCYGKKRNFLGNTYVRPLRMKVNEEVDQHLVKESTKGKNFLVFKTTDTSDERLYLCFTYDLPRP